MSKFLDLILFAIESFPIVILIRAIHIITRGIWYVAILQAMITDNCDEFKTSVKCGILLIFVIYAHTPSSAKPDPPMVIGKVERAVAAEVAIND